MDFESYLQEIFSFEYAEYPGDETTDEFDEWLADQPVDRIVWYANQWHKSEMKGLK